MIQVIKREELRPFQPGHVWYAVLWQDADIYLGTFHGNDADGWTPANCRKSSLTRQGAVVRVVKSRLLRMAREVNRLRIQFEIEVHKLEAQE